MGVICAPLSNYKQSDTVILKKKKKTDKMHVLNIKEKQSNSIK